MNDPWKTRTLIFDESGNLGVGGRYFVISCIDTKNPKELHNIMKKKIKIAKDIFPQVTRDGYEIKGSNAYPSIKHHILESVASKNLTISYIVADKKHVDPKLLNDKNLLYNFLLKILIDEVITSNCRNRKINLRLDNKTVKVQSINSFSDYISIHLNYQRMLNLDLDIEYIDSKARDGYIIQAADYVANAIYSYYEYKNGMYYDLLQPVKSKIELFPRKKFGLSKVI
jgi:hypothetical protein